MDVGVPFQISAKGRKNHDKTRCEIHGLILFKKHTGNNAVNSVKKAVKERAVMQEKIPELFIDGEDTVAVLNIYQFKGHRGSALHGVEIPAGRAEAAVASKRDKFQFAAFGAAKHSPAKGGIATVDHFIHVFNYRAAWM